MSEIEKSDSELKEELFNERVTEMTLLDYFAAKALPVAFKHVADIEDDETGVPFGFEFHGIGISADCDMTAEYAYELARAMMMERKHHV